MDVQSTTRRLDDKAYCRPTAADVSAHTRLADRVLVVAGRNTSLAICRAVPRKSSSEAASLHTIYAQGFLFFSLQEHGISRIMTKFLASLCKDAVTGKYGSRCAYMTDAELVLE